MHRITSWPRRALGRHRPWSGLVVAVVGLALTTVVLVQLRDQMTSSAVGLLFLVPVVATAVFGDLALSLAAVVAAGILVNFFFVAPLYTLHVTNAADVVLLAVYLLVAAVTSIAVKLAVRYRTTADTLAHQADHLAEVDQLRAILLAAVSHDLRTPLAGIKASVSTLREPDIELPNAHREELLAAIEDSSDELATLVDNLLSAGRLQAGQLSLQREPVALDGIAAAALVRTGAEAVLDVPDDLPLVLADAGLLEEALINLIRNAHHADQVWPLRIEGTVEGRRAKLAIIDHGPGVPEHDWERMFVPFQRLGEHPYGHGLGLGLTIVKGFVEAMEGTVTPAHTPGGGLTMTLALPLAEESP